MSETKSTTAGARTQTIRDLLASDKTLKISKIHSRPTADGIRSFFTVRRGDGPRGVILFRLAHFDMLVSEGGAR